ncbi:hypothetical protein M569_10211, partial [Genlisea aurea]
LSLWPPTQSTRLKLIEKMAKNLVTPSIWSRKYGLLSQIEAEAEAKQIESDSFAAATQHFDKEPDSDGSSAVEFYAKESSKRMIEVIKRGPLFRAEEEQQEEVASLQKKVKQNDGITFDISGDPRKEIDANEAEILLKPLKDPGNRYRRIRFSNTSFGRDAALVAKLILSSIKDQLTDVDLSDIVAGRQEEEAIEVMNIFSSTLQGSNLRLLDLSDNALGGKGVDAFGDLLRSQHSIEELYLNNGGISEDAAEALFVSVPSTEKLKVLQLHNNMVGDEGAAAIAHMVSNSPSLENLRCSSTRIASDGGLALVKSLGTTCPRLKKLDLRDNIFGVDVALALSRALSAFSELSELYLGYVNLEDEGAAAVADALTGSAPSLRVLDLAGNEITAKAAPALASCISSKRLLSEINLSENELKDEGAISIAKALEEGRRELSELDMSCNGIRRAGARRLAQVFVGKPEFSSLNINGNFISDEGIDEIKELFKNRPAVLGPLDENDPDGEDYDDDERNEADSDDGRELEAKLKGLDIKQGE